MNPSSFFSTLDWSQDTTENGTGVSEPVQEIKLPTEAEESLLGNTSDDDDDNFASLRTSDDVSKNEQNLGQLGSSSNFLTTKPVHVSKSESNMFDEETKTEVEDFFHKKESKTEVVDFFNMNNETGVQQSVNNEDLLKLEKDPTNLDLLSGTANIHIQSNREQKNLFSPTSDTFDPFQAFAARKQEPPSVSVSKTKEKNEFNSFDPFSSSGAKSDSDLFSSGLHSSAQTTTANEEDLMGSWDTHVTGFSNSPNISRNSSSSNIAGGTGGGLPPNNSGTFQMGGTDIPRNNSGAFQAMGGGTFQMGGANIPKTGSGTFQPVGASSNVPRNNSGPFQTMGGMGQAQGFGMKSQAGGRADPFADLGGRMFFLIYVVMSLSTNHLNAYILVVKK